MGSLLALAFAALLQAADPVAEGQKALEAQKYDVAVEHFKTAIANDAKDYAAHFHLGLAYSLLDRDKDAIPAFQKALELKPGLYEAELNLGMLYVRQEQFANAVPLLEAAHAKKPSEFRPAFYLAEALFGAQRFAEAEKAYAAASVIDPKAGHPLVGLARAKARQNRLDEAAADYKRAAAADPATADAILELASVYEAANEPRKAVEIYEQRLDNVAARERLGELLARLNEFERAIPHLEAAVKSSPTPANRLALAQSYLKANRAADGLKLLGEVAATEPANYDLQLYYGRTMRDQRNYQEAARAFLRAAQAKPDSVEAFSELSVILILAENYPTALQALDKVKALGGEKAGHVYFRAVVLDRMKQQKPALESYQRFLEMSTGQSPNEEFKARQRIKVLQKELERK
ncbi:MAG: tetratricopeptide repeat protein [Bryobacteraceae bacterium]|nr:tetratricopeptide repeat protein [Bryobacteraceae bacterium]